MGKISFYEKEADIKNYTRFMREYNPSNSDRVANGGHFHSSMELVYVLEGEHVGYVNGRAVRLKKDEIFFFNPYDVHYYNYLYENELFVLVIGKEYQTVYKELYGGAVFSNCMTDRARNVGVRALLEEWYGRYEYGNYLRNAGYTDLLLSELAQDYPPIAAKKSAGRESAIRMIGYLQENYRRNVTLGELADYMGYNKSYCSQLFGRMLGTDVRGYLNDIRAEQAWRLLQGADSSGETVLNIAMDCGFESMNTFYRAFRKRFGKTPREMLLSDRRRE